MAEEGYQERKPLTGNAQRGEPQPDKDVEEWREAMELLVSQLRFLRQDVRNFHAFKQMVENEVQPNVRGGFFGSCLWEWMESAYIETIGIGIRRLVDRDDRTESLLSLLKQIQKHPEKLRLSEKLVLWCSPRPPVQITPEMEKCATRAVRKWLRHGCIVKRRRREEHSPSTFRDMLEEVRRDPEVLNKTEWQVEERVEGNLEPDTQQLAELLDRLKSEAALEDRTRVEEEVREFEHSATDLESLTDRLDELVRAIIAQELLTTALARELPTRIEKDIGILESKDGPVAKVKKHVDKWIAHREQAYREMLRKKAAKAKAERDGSAVAWFDKFFDKFDNDCMAALDTLTILVLRYSGPIMDQIRDDLLPLLEHERRTGFYFDDLSDFKAIFRKPWIVPNGGAGG